MMLFFILFSLPNFCQVPAGLVCRFRIKLLYVTSLRFCDRTIPFPVPQLPSCRRGFSFRFFFTFLTPIHLSFFTFPHHPLHIPSSFHSIPPPLLHSFSLFLSYFPLILLFTLPRVCSVYILPTFCYEALPSPFCLSYSPFIYL
jgi:hypothetical protein